MVTNITARGRTSLCDILHFKIILWDSEYIKLLKKRDYSTEQYNRTVKRDTIHFIPTAGHPVTAKVLWLHPAQLCNQHYMLEKKVFVAPLKVIGTVHCKMVPKGASDGRPTGDYCALEIIELQNKTGIPFLTFKILHIYQRVKKYFRKGI